MYRLSIPTVRIPSVSAPRIGIGIRTPTASSIYEPLYDSDSDIITDSTGEPLMVLVPTT